MCNNNRNRFLTLFIVLFFFNNVESQQDSEKQKMAELPENVSPSKGVVIILLSIMFILAFLLLLYVKFCRGVAPLHLPNQNPNFQSRSSSIFSGVEKQVIETLPFFKFSSLKGSKEGLECTVCLSKFEDAEILRLLPKCKHAFHMNCIDTWLQSHSTCPLCRYRVEEIDIKNFTYSFSSRFLRVPSNLSEDPNLEIFIQREEEPSSCKKEQLLLFDQGGAGVKKWKHVHMINHKIFISDVVTRRRWSDLNSSDLLSLNSEMLSDMYSSGRFSPLEGISSSSNEEENSFTALNPVEKKRSMSEIANVPRFVEINKRNGMRECGGGDNGSEERLWRIWLPIVRRTAQWFARQERNSVVLEHKPLASNV